MNSASPSSLSTLSRQKTTPPSGKRDEAIKRGPWTPEEDEILAEFVRREGEGRWRTLPKRAGLRRCGKSCRLRWMNYLRPSIRRGPISLAEEDLILRLHRLLGNRWSLIAGRIPGRTDNEIKNYWNTYLSKKLISQGIDPRTHRPLSTNDYHGNDNNNNNNNFNFNTNHKIESTSATTVNCFAHPSANPITNPIPVSVLLGEMGGSIPTEEAHLNYFQAMNMEQETGSSWRNIEGFDGFGDDVFSFLDSLIGDNTSDPQQQQKQLHENVNDGDNHASTSTINNTKELGFIGPLSALWESPPQN
ncbi:hypothetical protein LUZ60_009335 [Juncus effusus]|nr:hypothetical protein LUZ60_009335 [Juncus effusus]